MKGEILSSFILLYSQHLSVATILFVHISCDHYYLMNKIMTTLQLLDFLAHSRYTTVVVSSVVSVLHDGASFEPEDKDLWIFCFIFFAQIFLILFNNCGGLNKKHFPQPQAFEHLVSQLLTLGKFYILVTST